MPDIDVIVVSYRTEAEVARLTSDLRESTVYPYKLHVFDNIGNPKTLTIAWNDLAAQGRAEYIAFFNPDIVICPEWDRMLIDAMIRRPDLGAILPVPMGSERPVQCHGRVIQGPWGDPPTQKDMGEIKAAIAGDDGIYIYCLTDPCAYFAVLMKRELFERLKGFDERFTLYGQDHEMQDRIRDLGMQTGALVSAPFWHGGSLSTKRARNHGEIHLHQEYVRFGEVLGPLRKGQLLRWHHLSDEDRAAVRRNPRYSKISKL